MLKDYKTDLHIHTCLSPCGLPESVPTRVVRQALDRGLQVIAICDHNASENVPAVKSAASGFDLTVLGGMEITTQEEIHLLAVFEDQHDVADMQNFIYDNLPGENNPEAFGQQYIVDAEDYVSGFNEHLLMGATNLSLEQIIDAVHQRNGLVIAAHIDRDAFSIVSQLGIIPPDLDLDAVELSPHHKSTALQMSDLGFPKVFFSDAHQIDAIGRAYTTFFIEEPSIGEIKKALQNREGRRILN